MARIGKPPQGQEWKNPEAEQDRKQLVVKSNEIIQRSRYKMNERENKIMLYMVSKIKPTDPVDTLYRFRISDFIRVSGDVDSGKNYKDVKAALEAIAERNVWITLPNGAEQLLMWLDHVVINQKTDLCEIRFNRDMLPYLFNLQTRYTSYMLEIALAMKSKYSIRLYELLKSYANTWEPITFDLSELKTRLDATTYERYPNFKQKVLDPAVYEINNVSDIKVSYTTATAPRGRAVEYVTFEIMKPQGSVKRLQEIRREREFNPD